MRDGVVVKVNSTVRVDLTLEVGAMTETVEVVQETPVLQTDRADTGRTIEGRQVAELPLGYNRSFQGMWVTVPGTVTMTRPHSQFFNPQDSQETKFNGQSRLSNNVQIDGLDDNHKTGLLTVLIPSAESIDSVNVSTSNFDAEFGKAGGSVTTVVLKSGTNQFHGSVVAFGNTESTQAKQYFASSTATKPKTKYEQFGASLGGPIIKDKLFFFADYQWTKDNLGNTYFNVVPPTAWRNGDFSSASTTIYDPATGNADGTGRTAVPRQRHPGGPHQPGGAEHPGAAARAEHPRRGDRPEQLRLQLHAREDDERRQRQAELQPHDQGPDVAPVQLPAAGDLRPQHLRARTVAPPTAASAGPAPRTPTAAPSPGRGRSARA